MTGKVVLVTGGVKSGKSSRALEWGDGSAGPRAFIATAEALDGEMAAKIARHQEERGGRYLTCDEPVRVGEALREMRARGAATLLLDCLTLWASNLLHHLEEEGEREAQIADLLAALEEMRREGKTVIVVTNEVGLGVIGLDPLTRRYVNLLGVLNRRVAEVCDQVEMVVSGIPVVIKG